MKLFYVDKTMKEEIQEFFPRISENRMSKEDSITPRICVASSIEGCVTAAPWKLKEVGRAEVLRVYEFDSEDIQEGNLLTPEDLFNQKKVPDAEITDEHWVINQSLKPIDMYYIQFLDFKEKSIKYHFDDRDFSCSKVYDSVYTKVFDVCYDKTIKLPVFQRLTETDFEELIHTLYEAASSENSFHESIKVEQKKGILTIKFGHSFGYSYEVLMNEVEEVINGLF